MHLQKLCLLFSGGVRGSNIDLSVHFSSEIKLYFVDLVLCASLVI